MSCTSNDIFDIVESIGSTPSKNDKVSIVKQHHDNELFRKVLVYTLDPLKTFNIRPMDPATTSNFTLGGSVFDDATWKLLDNLANRDITGNAAIEAVDAEFSRLDPKSANLLWRVINKDFRAGFSDSTVNKAIKDLIPEFPYMRCCLPKDTKLAEFSWEEGVYSQEKADGMFANVDFESRGNVRISSRSGTQFPVDQFAELIISIEETLEHGYQHHGELLVMKNGEILAREVGNGILNSVQQGGTFAADEKPVYKVWDRVELVNVVPKGKDLHPYKMRFAGLKALIEKTHTEYIQLIETRIVHSLAEAYVHYREMLALDKEGTIIKDGNAIWRDGTSKQQVKLKLEAECDLVIVGFTEGNGKNKELFGSILGQTSDGVLEVGVSGFKDKKQAGIPTRAEIHAMRDELIGTIMAVKFNDIMYATKEDGKHSLFLPRFAEFRRDKTTADSFERVVEQLEAAKQAHVV